MSAQDAISEELLIVRRRLSRALAELGGLVQEARDGIPSDSRVHIRQLQAKLDTVAEYVNQRDATRTALGNAIVNERRKSG